MSSVIWVCAGCLAPIVMGEEFFGSNPAFTASTKYVPGSILANETVPLEPVTSGFPAGEPSFLLRVAFTLSTGWPVLSTMLTESEPELVSVAFCNLTSIVWSDGFTLLRLFRMYSGWSNSI